MEKPKAKRKEKKQRNNGGITENNHHSSRVSNARPKVLFFPQKSSQKNSVGVRHHGRAHHWLTRWERNHVAMGMVVGLVMILSVGVIEAAMAMAVVMLMLTVIVLKRHGALPWL
jgi:hypothetical protein